MAKISDERRADMDYRDEHGDILVSLRDLNRQHTDTFGHLALGALIGPDRVLLDLPVDLVIPEDAQLEILISLVAPGEADVIEHIRPLQVVIRSLEATPSARV